MWGTVIFVSCASHLINVVESTFIQRTWTYQSTIRVDAMGMEGNAFDMHGRGITTIAQGSDLIYETTDSGGSALARPSTVWVGSCVYESDYDGFVRCVNRKTPVYRVDSNPPVCTLSYPDRTVLTADTYCDGPMPNPGTTPYYYHSAPYDPTTPASVADNVGDLYGAHVSLAGDLEFGKLLAVGAPKTYTAGFQDNFGAVYMHTGEYKHWTETQRLYPNDSNMGLTANKPDFGQIVEIDKVTSRNALVACPQCVSVSTTEGAVYVYKTSNGRTWSSTQQLIADDATTSDYTFGKNVKIHDEFALIAAQGLNTRGALYIFREERHSIYKDGVYNGQWTQQQKLVPTDAYIRGSGSLWGTKADLHGKTLVVGQSDEPTYGVSTGAAYVYKSSKTMELPHNHWGFTGRRNLGATDDDPKPKPIPMHKWWSQVAKLYPADPHIYRLFGDEVAIWGDAIAVSGPGESLNDADWTTGTNTQFGSVYLFSRESFSSDSWTQQQKLYNPDVVDETFFFNDVDSNYQNNALIAGDLDGNRFGKPRLYGSSLTVTSAGDTPYSAYTYYMSDNVDWKCLLITVGDGMGDGWNAARLVATAPFGPTREVKTDTFSQFCDAYNYDNIDEMKPLSRKTQETYRYCPLDAHNHGDYVFEILGQPRASKGEKGKPSDNLFWREIYWDIYNEWDRSRYIGDAHTKLTFNWGEKDFFFTLKKEERVWKAPEVCTQCNLWEGLQKKGQKQPKPKPSPQDADEEDTSRRLNLYPTPSPTVSMPPTLAWASNYNLDQWMFVMGRNTANPGYGSTTTWTDQYMNGTGTYFYIYDSNGQNITEPLIWGQLCSMTGSIQDSCSTQNLDVDGTYTLRVTGGMDYRRSEIQWKFCNVEGTAQQTLIFRKHSSTCLPIAHFDSDGACERNGFSVKADGTIVLKGMFGLYSEKRDTVVVETAIKKMLEPYTVSNINIFVNDEKLYSSSSEDVEIRAEMEFDSTVNGINMDDGDGLRDFESDLVQKFGYYDDNNLMASVFSSAAHDLLGLDSHSIMSGASFESHLSHLEITRAEMMSTKVLRDRVQTPDSVASSDSIEETVEVQTKVAMDHETQIEYNILNAEAIGGYVIMTCALLAVVVVAMVSLHQSAKAKKQKRAMNEPSDLERLMETDDDESHAEWKSQKSSRKKSKGRDASIARNV